MRVGEPVELSVLSEVKIKVVFSGPCTVSFYEFAKT
jgi:hypothetical protein